MGDDLILRYCLNIKTESLTLYQLNDECLLQSNLHSYTLTTEISPSGNPTV